MRREHETRVGRGRWPMPADPTRHELHDVEHLAPRRPSLRHRVVAMNLALQVGRFLRDHPVGTVYVAPVDVELSEVEVAESGLVKVDPILLWHEREVWQYLALHAVPVNPLYGEGYRSLGCQPCTEITTGADERSGRWAKTRKVGGECGIHTRDMGTRQTESAAG